MRLCERLGAEQIFLDVPLANKEDVLRFAAGVFEKIGATGDAEAAYGSMRKREEVMSTGIGDGIGIPHAAAAGANRAAVCLFRLAESIDFSALDKKPVDVVLAMIVPDSERMLHLQILAGIARLCRNPAFMQAVRTENDSVKLWSLICRLEEEMAFR